MFDYANWTDPEGKARLPLQLPAVRELVRGGAQEFDPHRDRDTFEQHLRDQLGCQQPHDVADHDNNDDYDDNVPEDGARPLDLDETIRAVICTSDTPDDLAGGVQQAIGEYTSASDELHVSHAIAPDPRTGLMLYTAPIVLRPPSDPD